MERNAQKTISDPKPTCYGLVYDARDVNCTACKASATCMYDFYNCILRPRITELGDEKPYLDLIDFEALSDADIANMINTEELSDIDITENIRHTCNCTLELAEMRLSIIKAKLRYEGTIS